MQPTTTARLALRPITAGDAELLRVLDSDPQVMRYLSGGTPTSLKAIESRILPHFLAYSRQEAWAGVWLGFERGAGTFAGWFSLRPASAGCAELGYRLRRTCWGRGLATEGAQALLEHAFEGRRIERIFATTYEENIASRRVLEKLGMNLVRRFRPEPGAASTFEEGDAAPWPGDDLEYAIDAETWATNHRNI